MNQAATEPIGLVHIAMAGAGRPTQHTREVFPGSRAAVRDSTVVTAFAMLRNLLGGA